MATLKFSGALRAQVAEPPLSKFLDPPLLGDSVSMFLSTILSRYAASLQHNITISTKRMGDLS